MTEVALDFGIEKALKALGVEDVNPGSSTGMEHFGSGEEIASVSPVDGATIARVRATTQDDYRRVAETAASAFTSWRMVPAPQRGEIVRQFSDRLRELKEPLGKLVSYEMGKSYQEGLGEVQE